MNASALLLTGLIPPPIVPTWVTTAITDFQNMFAGRFDFADPLATYRRCDDIARLLFRHLRSIAPRGIAVEVLDMHFYRGQALTGDVHPKTGAASRRNHKAVLLLSLHGTSDDDLVVDLAGSQFGDWPEVYTAGSALQCWKRVITLEQSVGICGMCSGKPISLAQAIDYFCTAPTRLCKNCDGTGKFLLDTRIRREWEAHWEIRVNGPEAKVWIARYANVQYGSRGHTVIHQPRVTSDMVLDANGTVVATTRPELDNAPKPERNSPCPCGSGKKYKQCCLR